jgi:hypothetical protein
MGLQDQMADLHLLVFTLLPAAAQAAYPLETPEQMAILQMTAFLRVASAMEGVVPAALAAMTLSS